MFGAIRPLAALNSQTIRPLLDDESEAWRAELGWDITSTAELIVRSAALNRIEGMVMVRSGRALAYIYYHAREAKSVIGSAHALRRRPSQRHPACPRRRGSSGPKPSEFPVRARHSFPRAEPRRGP